LSANIEQHEVDISELRHVVADVLELDEESITDDAHFVDDLGVSSLMALEVMVVLERRYGVSISEQELKDMTSMRRVHALLGAKLAGQG
jgi:acyl carrier protein